MEKALEFYKKQRRKILMFKYSYLENYELLDKDYLGCREHKEIVSKIPKN